MITQQTTKTLTADHRFALLSNEQLDFSNLFHFSCNRFYHFLSIPLRFTVWMDSFFRAPHFVYVYILCKCIITKKEGRKLTKKIVYLIWLNSVLALASNVAQAAIDTESFKSTNVKYSNSIESFGCKFSQWGHQIELCWYYWTQMPSSFECWSKCVEINSIISMCVASSHFAKRRQEQFVTPLTRSIHSNCNYFKYCFEFVSA